MGCGVSDKNHSRHSPDGNDHIWYLQHEHQEQHQTDEHQEDSQPPATVSVTQTLRGSAVGIEHIRVGGRGGGELFSYACAVLKHSIL